MRRVNGRCSGTRQAATNKSDTPGNCCQDRTLFHAQGFSINSIIWCVVGAVIGALAGLAMRTQQKSAVIENVLVGVFGAFVGGDFVVSMLPGGVANDPVFHLRSLGCAMGGSLLFVLALRLMRSSVGPQREHARKPKHRI